MMINPVDWIEIIFLTNTKTNQYNFIGAFSREASADDDVGWLDILMDNGR